MSTMKTTQFVACVQFVYLIVYFISSCNSKSLKAVQILTSVDQSFYLSESKLRKILEVDGIKERKIVVISVAGTVQNGNDFLLSLFLRYLNAKVRGNFTSELHFFEEVVQLCHSLSHFPFFPVQKPR